MEPETITFDPLRLTSVGEQKVYVKPYWDADWVDVSSELWASQVTWTMAPAFPFAQLECRYGRRYVANGDGTGWHILRPQDLLGQWVMIVVGTPATKDAIQSQRRWIGRIEVEADNRMGQQWIEEEGEKVLAKSGKQYLIAYGIEKMLDKHQITDSFCQISGTDAKRVKRAITFNDRGVGNCAPDANLFCANRDQGELWTIEDMLWYLVKYGVPEYGKRQFESSGTTEPIIPFELYGVEEEWLTETPEVPVEGKTLFHLLNSLLPRFRLRGWYCELSPERNGPCKLQVVSLAGPKQSEGEALARYPESPALKILDFQNDHSAVIDVKTSNLEKYREVIVRGARATSTGTFGYGEGIRRITGDFPYEKTLLPGWTEEQESRYSQGASGEENYEKLSPGLKEAANKAARSDIALRTVFTKYVIDPEFRGYLGTERTFPLFPSIATVLDSPDRAFYIEDFAAVDLRFTRLTALYGEIDYQANWYDIRKQYQKTFQPLPPAVYFPTPETAYGLWQEMRWFPVDTQGLLADLPESGMDKQRYWSASVTVDNEGALRVVPLGEMPDILAGQSWSRQENDWEPLADWREMLVTATVEYSGFCEGHASEYKLDSEETEDDADREYRTLVLYAGDRYRLDHLAPGTVLGLDAEGKLLTREEGVFIRDDREELEQQAEEALAWYSQPRKVLHVQTALVSAEVNIGDYVVGLDQGEEEPDPINSVVTEITYTADQSESWRGRPQVRPPGMEITTGYGELDPLRMGD